MPERYTGLQFDEPTDTDWNVFCEKIGAQESFSLIPLINGQPVPDEIVQVRILSISVGPEIPIIHIKVKVLEAPLGRMELGELTLPFEGDGMMCMKLPPRPE